MSADSLLAAHHTAADLFGQHAAVFGADLAIYAGHVHRVIALVGLQREVPDESATLLGVAAFFHDAGIWFSQTWDYLAPSAALATSALAAGDDPGGLVPAMICEHHRIRRALHANPLVEAFRRADLGDISNGLLRPPSVGRAAYRDLLTTYPGRGFRPMLARAFGRGLRADPWHPAPMVKW